jgi:hypothetical protein
VRVSGDGPSGTELTSNFNKKILLGEITSCIRRITHFSQAQWGRFQTKLKKNYDY